MATITTKLQMRRILSSDTSTFLEGEPLFATDDNSFYIGTGVASPNKVKIGNITTVNNLTNDEFNNISFNPGETKSFNAVDMFDYKILNKSTNLTSDTITHSLGNNNIFTYSPNIKKNNSNITRNYTFNNSLPDDKLIFGNPDTFTAATYTKYGIANESTNFSYLANITKDKNNTITTLESGIELSTDIVDYYGYTMIYQNSSIIIISTINNKGSLTGSQYINGAKYTDRYKYFTAYVYDNAFNLITKIRTDQIGVSKPGYLFREQGDTLFRRQYNYNYKQVRTSTFGCIYNNKLYLSFTYTTDPLLDGYDLMIYDISTNSIDRVISKGAGFGCNGLYYCNGEIIVSEVFSLSIAEYNVNINRCDLNLNHIGLIKNIGISGNSTSSFFCAISKFSDMENGDFIISEFDNILFNINGNITIININTPHRFCPICNYNNAYFLVPWFNTNGFLYYNIYKKNDNTVIPISINNLIVSNSLISSIIETYYYDLESGYLYFYLFYSTSSSNITVKKIKITLSTDTIDNSIPVISATTNNYLIGSSQGYNITEYTRILASPTTHTVDLNSYIDVSNFSFMTFSLNGSTKKTNETTTITFKDNLGNNITNWINKNLTGLSISDTNCIKKINITAAGTTQIFLDTIPIMSSVDTTSYSVETAAFMIASAINNYRNENGVSKFKCYATIDSVYTSRVNIEVIPNLDNVTKSERGFSYVNSMIISNAGDSTISDIVGVTGVDGLLRVVKQQSIERFSYSLSIIDNPSGEDIDWYISSISFPYTSLYSFSNEVNNSEIKSYWNDNQLYITNNSSTVKKLDIKIWKKLN